MAHLGNKALLENLRNDVMDVQTALEWLCQIVPKKDTLRRCKSWKYPGSTVVDVDIKSLLRCFGHYNGNLEESKKSHVIMVELAIDRLVAVLNISAAVLNGMTLEYYGPRSSFGHTFENFGNGKSLAASVTSLRTGLTNFLLIWGIGCPEKDPLLDTESQTDFTYCPHIPCSRCQYLRDNLEKVFTAVEESFGIELSKSNTNMWAGELGKGYNLMVNNHCKADEEVLEQTELLRQVMEESAWCSAQNLDLDRKLVDLKNTYAVLKGATESLVQELALARRRTEDQGILKNNAEAESRRLGMEIDHATGNVKKLLTSKKELYLQMQSQEENEESSPVKKDMLHEQQQALYILRQKLRDLDQSYGK